MWHSGGQRTPLGVHLTFQFLHGLPYCAGLHTPRQPSCQCARTQVAKLLVYKNSDSHAASVQGLRQPHCQCARTQIVTLLVCKDSPFIFPSQNTGITDTYTTESNSFSHKFWESELSHRGFKPSTSPTEPLFLKFSVFYRPLRCESTMYQKLSIHPVFKGFSLSILCKSVKRVLKFIPLGESGDGIIGQD